MHICWRQCVPRLRVTFCHDDRLMTSEGGGTDVRVWHWSRQCSMGRMQLTGRVKVGVLFPLVLWHPLLICFREWHCPFSPAHSNTTKMLLSRFTRGVEACALFMPPLLASSKCRSTAIFWLAKMSESPGDFWQLSTLIANISGTHRHVENLNSTWSTTFHPLLGEKNWWPLVY